MGKIGPNRRLVQQQEFIRRYENRNEPLEAKYGLPSDVQFCRKCVISNQRPNSSVEFLHNSNSAKATISFGEDQVCDACKHTEFKKGSIDWEHRDRQLRDLCDKHRRTDGSYDCIIPGSGGKDSFFTSHMLKYKYGMNPLTVTWAPHLYTDWGWKNFQSWIHAGFDNHLVTPNGRVHRLLTRLALEKLLHPFQPFILGQKMIAPRLASTFNIPLVFYGENEAEYGNPEADNKTSMRSPKFHSSNSDLEMSIAGISVKELTENFDVKRSDLDLYMPVDQQTLAQSKVEVHYLGYFLPWHPQEVYYYAVENGGFEPSPERTVGSYSKYISIDDKIDDFHFYTYFIKFGLGRASSDAAQEIRNQEIERDEGVALVKKFDGEFPERFFDDILTYLSITKDEFPKSYKMFNQPIMDRDYFHDLCDSFRSPHLWMLENGEWRLRESVWGS